MDVIDIRTFVPSRDYEVSRSFYTEIGFQPEYVTDDLTLYRNGACFFFLQRFYQQNLAEHFMLQICVSDIEQAYARCAEAKHKTRIAPIEQASWGRVFYLWGPSASCCISLNSATRQAFQRRTSLFSCPWSVWWMATDIAFCL